MQSSSETRDTSYLTRPSLSRDLGTVTEGPQRTLTIPTHFSDREYLLSWGSGGETEDQTSTQANRMTRPHVVKVLLDWGLHLPLVSLYSMCWLDSSLIHTSPSACLLGAVALCTSSRNTGLIPFQGWETDLQTPGERLAMILTTAPFSAFP